MKEKFSKMNYEDYKDVSCNLESEMEKIDCLYLSGNLTVADRDFMVQKIKEKFNMCE